MAELQVTLEESKKTYIYGLNQLDAIISANKIIKHFLLSYSDCPSLLAHIEKQYRNDKIIIHNELIILKLETIVNRFFTSIISVINNKKISDSNISKEINKLKDKKNLLPY